MSLHDNDLINHLIKWAKAIDSKLNIVAKSIPL